MCVSKRIKQKVASVVTFGGVRFEIRREYRKTKNVIWCGQLVRDILLITAARKLVINSAKHYQYYTLLLAPDTGNRGLERSVASGACIYWKSMHIVSTYSPAPLQNIPCTEQPHENYTSTKTAEAPGYGNRGAG